MIKSSVFMASLLISVIGFAQAVPKLVYGFHGFDLIPKNGQKLIALTFDDGPRPESTGKILDILKKYEKQYGIRLKSTFFVTGNNAYANPDMLKRIVKEGHVLANHTYSHCDLSNTLAPERKSNVCDVDKSLIYKDHADFVFGQLGATHNLIKGLIPNQHFLFRAPHGFWLKDDTVLLAQHPELKKYVGPIYWSVGGEVMPNEGILKRTFTKANPYPANVQLTAAADWQCWEKSYNFSIERCLSGYKAELSKVTGGVILMHDIFDKTAQMIDMWIPQLIQQGYKFVTVDELPLIKKKQQELKDQQIL